MESLFGLESVSRHGEDLLIQLLLSLVKCNGYISLLIMLQSKCKESLLKDSHFGLFFEMTMDRLGVTNICKVVMLMTVLKHYARVF